MELVLKTSDGVKPTVSSNLTASANNENPPQRGGFYCSYEGAGDSNNQFYISMFIDTLTHPNGVGLARFADFLLTGKEA